MSRRRILLGWALLVATTLTACAPPYTVIRQATPNPFTARRTFYFEPIRFDGLTIDDVPESIYLGGLNPTQQPSYATDKGAMISRYVGRAMHNHGQLSVSATPDSGAIIVRSTLTYLTIGAYMSLSPRPTNARMTVQLLTPQGATLDSIVVRASVSATVWNAAFGTRIRVAGEQLSDGIIEYLQLRARGA